MTANRNTIQKFHEFAELLKWQHYGNEDQASLKSPAGVIASMAVGQSIPTMTVSITSPIPADAAGHLASDLAQISRLMANLYGTITLVSATCPQPIKL